MVVRLNREEGVATVVRDVPLMFRQVGSLKVRWWYGGAPMMFW